MKEYSGKSVCGGIAVGTIRVHEKGARQTEPVHVEDVDGEIRRFENARSKAIAQLKNLYNKAAKEVGMENAAIFEIHSMMLEDPDYIKSVEDCIKTRRVNCEFVVEETSCDFAERFSQMDDEYMQARAADVKDISDRIVTILAGRENAPSMQEPSIIFAEDLAPSETLQMDKSKILAFVTSKGSANSHTAILARTMNIPAIVNTDIENLGELDGHYAVIDGHKGAIYVDPTEDIKEKALRRKESDAKDMEELREFIGKESKTADGKKLMVYCNIGNITDLEAVTKNDGEGIGLFRSEFLYLERKNYPTEEEQFSIYKTALEAMGGKKVIIRTLDIGADKQVPYFHIEPEENPALGLRAIRLCLKRPELFKTQLRALLRASVYGSLGIMYPMITSAEELDEIEKLYNQVREELISEGVPIGNPEQGIMVETPAAAVISDILADKVDFFSIGTNDLSQYTLAIDRQNRHAEEFFNPHHKAVLRMIKTTVDNAHAKGKWVGICGELAGDLELTELFAGMGIDELSVSPPKVLPLRKRISQCDSKMTVDGGI